MRWITVIALALLASCKDQGPKGLDPIVLARNQQSGVVPVVLTWYDQSGQVQADTVPPNSTQCYHFTSTTVADSVRFEIAMGDPVWQWQKSPWFNPLTGLPTTDADGNPISSPEAYPFGAEYWTLTITENGPSMQAVAEPPC